MPRVKRRYILFRIESLVPDGNDKKCSLPLKIHEGDLVNAVRDMVQKLHGDYGLASILFNFHLKSFDCTTGTGVLVVKRESYQFILTALPLIKTIREQNVYINTLKVTGTLRGSLRALQGFHGKKIFEYKKMLHQQRKKMHIISKEQITQGFKSLINKIEEGCN